MRIKPFVILVIAASFWGLSARAQSALPATFGSWSATAASQQAPAEKIQQIAGPNAPLLDEYGINAAERRMYSSGANTASVTLYNMLDPSAAYGAFTLMRTDKMTPLQLGGGVPYAAASRDEAIFVVGNFLTDVSSPQERPGDSDLASLASVFASRADKRPFPRIVDFLPQQGLVPLSERYLLGPIAAAQAFPSSGAGQADWLGFDKSAEAVAGRYHAEGQAKGQPATPPIVLYPTQQIAADEYAGLNKWFALNAAAGTATKPLVFGTRQSNLVALVTGTDSRDVASSLLSQVHLASSVTWNEPSNSYSDPSIYTIVIGAMLHTGFIMVVALAAGFGFGGFRLLMKFVAPGRVFDRQKNVEILQLGLGSKPIDVEDFYR